MDDMFAWELIYKLTESEIGKNEDVLLVLVHFCLIRSGYKCLGVGEHTTLCPDEPSTETLPAGWSCRNDYSLRYVKNNQLVVLRAIPSGGSLVFNLMLAPSLSVTSIAFSIQDDVKATKGDIKAMMPNYKEMTNKVKRELLDPIATRTDKDEGTQTSQQPQRPDLDFYETNPISVGPRPGAEVDPFWSDPDRDPLRVGQSDLDPLARGGGGMIFNPFGRGRLPHQPDPGLIPGGIPRGSIPPGARFDPFGPPLRSSRPRPRPPPDSDHFEPPGFGGMFM